jgi:hypothetical protein
MVSVNPAVTQKKKKKKERKETIRSIYQTHRHVDHSLWVALKI